MGYTKLFEELVRSSIWDEDDKTRVVWVTMLALKDRNHFVRGTETFLALAARVDAESLRKALDKLSGPDPKSHTPANNGARVRSAEGGWVILNGEKYSRMLSAEERREYQRVKQAEYRSRRRVIKRSAQIEGSTQAVNDGLADLR